MGAASRCLLYVETEEYDVAVLHHIFLAFAANKTFFLCRRHAAAGDQVVIGDDLGANEAAFKVGVDLSGCLGRLEIKPSSA